MCHKHDHNVPYDPLLLSFLSTPNPHIHVRAAKLMNNVEERYRAKFMRTEYRSIRSRNTMIRMTVSRNFVCFSLPTMTNSTRESWRLLTMGKILRDKYFWDDRLKMLLITKYDSIHNFVPDYPLVDGSVGRMIVTWTTERATWESSQAPWSATYRNFWERWYLHEDNALPKQTAWWSFWDH